MVALCSMCSAAQARIAAVLFRQTCRPALDEEQAAGQRGACSCQLLHRAETACPTLCRTEAWPLLHAAEPSSPARRSWRRSCCWEHLPHAAEGRHLAGAEAWEALCQARAPQAARGPAQSAPPGSEALQAPGPAAVQLSVASTPGLQHHAACSAATAWPGTAGTETATAWWVCTAARSRRHPAAGAGAAGRTLHSWPHGVRCCGRRCWLLRSRRCRACERGHCAGARRP